MRAPEQVSCMQDKSVHGKIRGQRLSIKLRLVELAAKGIRNNHMRCNQLLFSLSHLLHALQGGRCGVWQHCECVGVSKEAMPEHFFCEQCRAAWADPFWEVSVLQCRHGRPLHLPKVSVVLHASCLNEHLQGMWGFGQWHRGVQNACVISIFIACPPMICYGYNEIIHRQASILAV